MAPPAPDTAARADPAATPPPVARRTGIENAPDGRVLLGLFLANLALRTALLPVNLADYTDGVLQVTQATDPTALWPPLYGWLVAGLSWLLGPVYAGRFISALAGAAGVVPLWLIARRAGGRRAAFYAALVYTLAPVSLRWSARMMSDALFATLFWFGLERWDAAARTRKGNPDGALAAAMLFAAAATLARYQGVLLLPLIGLTWLRTAWGWRRTRTQRDETTPATRTPDDRTPEDRTPRAFPWRTLVAAPMLLVAPVWVRLQGIAHGEQFADRLGDSLLSAAAVVSLNAEAFLAYTPYFLTYPVAAFALFGLMRGASHRRSDAETRMTEATTQPERTAAPPSQHLNPSPDIEASVPVASPPPRSASAAFAGTGWTPYAATIFVGLALLGLQGAFSSFQERYMMPWYGLLWVWAGIGLAVAQDLLRRRARVFSAMLAATLFWSAFAALCVLVFQRETFGDFAAAGRWLRENAPPDAAVYSTEIYNPNLGGRLIATNKMRFYSQREVQFLPPPHPASQDIPPGSFVCLHSVSPFWTEEMLARFYKGERVFEFDAVILPLFSDVMATPGTAQNPTAWVFRYTPQPFWTSIWRVDGRRSP